MCGVSDRSIECCVAPNAFLKMSAVSVMKKRFQNLKEFHVLIDPCILLCRSEDSIPKMQFILL